MKRFLSLLALTLTGIPALATSNGHEAHLDLIRTVEEVVEVRVNPVDCWEMRNTYGYYWGAKKLLVICQQNAIRADVHSVWTAEDYDTLRHEVHHLIQDCSVGGAGDMRTGLFFDDAEDYASFVNDAIPRSTVLKIRNAYADKDPRDIEMEVEAFAVASVITAEILTGVVNKVCEL